MGTRRIKLPRLNRRHGSRKMLEAIAREELQPPRKLLMVKRTKSILAAVRKLQPEAYGNSIQIELAENQDLNLSLGTIYVMLDNLESGNKVRSRFDMGQAFADRGNRPRKLWTVID